MSDPKKTNSERLAEVAAQIRKAKRLSANTVAVMLDAIAEGVRQDETTAAGWFRDLQTIVTAVDKLGVSAALADARKAILVPRKSDQ